MTFQNLPERYVLYREFDLAKEPGLYRRAFMLGCGIAAVMLIAALPFVPFSSLVPVHAPARSAALRILLLLPAVYFCMLLRELIRSAVFRRFHGGRNRWHRIGITLSVGSDAFYDRSAFLMILISPAAMMGMLLMILNFALSVSWFWFIYIIQIVNLTGISGDLILMRDLSRLPRTILIRNDGERVEVYAPAEKNR